MKYVYALIGFIIVAAAGYFYFRDSRNEQAAVALAGEYIELVSREWNAGTLKELADPGLIKAMASQGQSAEELLNIYSVLGKLKGSMHCRFISTSSTIKGGERHVMDSFECRGEYDKGPAVVSLTLIKADSAQQWLIYYINVHSDVFGEIIE